MARKSQGRIFGKRSEPHVLILACGDNVRHMTVRPWMAATLACVAGLFTVGYLGATSYLVFRDSLMGASSARQARVQHDYEDRIAALRSQLDRITSRQLLDQQVVEEKVEKLLEQQMALSLRQGKIGTLLDKASEKTSRTGADVPVPMPSPLALGKQASLAPGNKGVEALENLLSGGKAPSSAKPVTLAAYAPSPRESVADHADRVFTNVTRSLKSIETEQLTHIAGLADDASGTADAISSILRGTGVDVPEIKVASANTAMGGPFIPVGGKEAFDVSLHRLDKALDHLENVRETARKLPYGNPAPGRDITSTFGTRTDPFFGRPALHAGIDFRSEVGAPIRATGAGKVIAAGFSGGYGNMVEIDHGQGIITRYGHMSRIIATVGQHVELGDEIGEAGSTGRSTGPHLHYEVRRDGQPIDPMRFLNAGIKLTNYLN